MDNFYQMMNQMGGTRQQLPPEVGGSNMPQPPQDPRQQQQAVAGAVMGGAMGTPQGQPAQPPFMGRPQRQPMVDGQPVEGKHPNGQPQMVDGQPPQMPPMEIPDKEEKLSLDTLSEDEKKKILASFKRSKTIANNYYRSEIESRVIERTNIYEASKHYYRKKFPRLSETSEWISKDVKTTIDWIVPSLLEVFIGNESPVDIQGVNANDDATAKKIQQLLKYQMERKNNYFTFMYPLIKEGLKTNFGVAKVYWNRTTEPKNFEMMAGEAELNTLLSLHEADKIDIKAIDPLDMNGDYFRLEWTEERIKDNFPVLECMPISELRFTPESKTLQDAKFVAHRKVVTGDYLKRKEREGVFEHVDKALKEAGSVKLTALEYKENADRREYEFADDNDDASKQVELYEAYMKVDYNKDGVYEDIIVHAVGDVLLSVQENEFEQPPFFIWSPEYTPYKVFGKESFSDNLEQLQDLKTALIRQIITATAKNNSPRMFLNMDKVDMDALEDNEEVIPVRNWEGDVSSAIFYAPQIPISQWGMSLVEYAQNEVEAQSGSTRYNQGLDSNSLNKTATGIQSIMGAADKRTKLLARMFAETLLIPLVKFLIKLNQKFMDDEAVVRLIDETMTIKKEDLNIEYDLVVNVGAGASTREASIQYLMLIINQIYPILQQQGIVDPTGWFNIVKELLEKMGMRNVTNYLLDPNNPQVQAMKQQQQAQAQQQQQAVIQQQAQNAQQLQQEKNKPKLTINYKDLPAEAKREILSSYGSQVTPEDMAQKEMSDMMTAVRRK